MLLGGNALSYSKLLVHMQGIGVWGNCGFLAAFEELLGQGLKDRLYHLAVAEAGAVDRDIGEGLVEGKALVVEIGEILPGGDDDASGIHVGDARFEVGQRQLQVHDAAVSL